MFLDSESLFHYSTWHERENKTLWITYENKRQSWAVHKLEEVEDNIKIRYLYCILYVLATSQGNQLSWGTINYKHADVSAVWNCMLKLLKLKYYTQYYPMIIMRPWISSKVTVMYNEIKVTAQNICFLRIWSFLHCLTENLIKLNFFVMVIQTALSRRILIFIGTWWKQELPQEVLYMLKLTSKYRYCSSQVIVNFCLTTIVTNLSVEYKPYRTETLSPQALHYHWWYTTQDRAAFQDQPVT